MHTVFGYLTASSSPSNITLQKTVLLTISILLLLSCFCGLADAKVLDEGCGNGVYYRLDTETGVLNIYGNGKIEDYKGSNAPWNKYRTDITSLIIQPEITYIGNNAFNGCTNLKTVTFPESFRNQYHNFGGDKITGIGERAFYNCKSLTDFKIPTKISSIGKEAFFNCSSLKSIPISSYVKSIGASAFGGCTKLTEIVVDENNKHYMSIDGVLYEKNDVLNQPETLLLYPLGKQDTEYTISSPVKTIAASAFKNCSTLTVVTISGSVTTIEEEAFYNCKKLTSVDMPNALTTIKKNVFAKCISLKSIEIPLTTAKICAGAFKDCASLETVSFPEKSQVEIIEDEAFSGCSHLTKIEMPKSLRTVGKNALHGLSSNSVIYYTSGMKQSSSEYELEKTVIAKEDLDHTHFTFYVHSKINDGKLLLTENNAPTKDEYTFMGWYADEDFKTKVTEIPMNSDMVLYPKWIKTVLLPQTTPTATPTATPSKKPTAAPTKKPTPVPTKQVNSSSGKDTKEDAQTPEKTVKSKTPDTNADEKTTQPQFGFNGGKYAYHTWTFALQDAKKQTGFSLLSLIEKE